MSKYSSILTLICESFLPSFSAFCMFQEKSWKKKKVKCGVHPILGRYFKLLCRAPRARLF